MELKIKLGTVNDAVLFTAKCNEYDEDIDYLYDSRHVLDAKSIVSVIAAGIGEIRNVIIHTDNALRREEFKNDMQLWLIEEGY